MLVVDKVLLYPSDFCHYNFANNMSFPLRFWKHSFPSHLSEYLPPPSLPPSKIHQFRTLHDAPFSFHIHDHSSPI